jgi:hypothetical protein
MKSTGMADSPLFKKVDQMLVSPETLSNDNSQPHHDTIPPNHQVSMIASITKSIREIGKEASTYRLTRNEKTALIEVIYNYRMQNIRLNENEIARIAINFITSDFKNKKKESILARVIDSLTT